MDRKARTKKLMILGVDSLLPAIATCIFIPLAVSLAVKVSSGSLLITQGATASATFRATNVAEPVWNCFVEAGKKTLVMHWPGGAWPPTYHKYRLYF